MSDPNSGANCDHDPFNGDAEFIAVATTLLEDFNIDLVVETGTFRGATTQWFGQHGKRVVTLELEPTRFAETSHRLSSQTNILCLNGSSSEVLPKLLPHLKGRILFYLDAHWGDSWPIHDEILAIATNHSGNCVIVVDHFEVPSRPDIHCDSFDGQALSIDHVRPELIKALPNGNYRIYVPSNPRHRGRLVAWPHDWQTTLPNCFDPAIGMPMAVPVYEDINGIASRQAVQDPAKFALFRQDPRFIDMLEHVYLEHAQVYWQQTVQEFGHLLPKFDWDDLRRIDLVGGPTVHDFPQVSEHVNLSNYEFSTNFFRYLYTGLCILREIKSTLNPVRILEIGCGYGGQAKAIFSLASLFGLEIGSYTLIDLTDPIALQLKFLAETKAPIDRIKGHSYPELVKTDFKQLHYYYDIGFSNFAFSEFGKDNQDVYAAHVLPRCQQLYMIYNTPKVHPALATLKESPEIPRTGPYNRILSGQGQKIHFHDRNVSHLPDRQLNILTSEPDILAFERGCTGSDFAVFTDRCLSEVNDCPAKHKVAWLWEPRELDPRAYEFVENYRHLFTDVWTHELNFPTFRNTWVLHVASWITNEERIFYDKSKDVSFIASDKDQLTGHLLRQEVRRALPLTVDRFGGVDGFVQNKLTALKDYRFSIVIENVQVDTSFTEKIIDCFVTGTIPVYWGSRLIPFQQQGIIYFNDLEELLALLQTLNADLYEKMKPAALENFNIARRFLQEGETHETGLLSDGNTLIPLETELAPNVAPEIPLAEAMPTPSVLQIQLAGGLGNQLFQIGAGLALAETRNAQVLFAPCLDRGVNWSARFGLPTAEIAIGTPCYYEPAFQYQPIPNLPEQRLALVGYWQSDCYLRKSHVQNLLKPWIEEATLLRAAYPDNCVALHVRRTDYLQLSKIHNNLSLDYYLSALEEVDVTHHTLVFSDDPNWCKETFPKFQCVDLPDPLLSLLVMSQCQTIIAANSSFSWWAGYLSAEGTKVVLPRKWFAEEGPSQWDSIYYHSMSRIKETPHAYVFEQLGKSRKIGTYYINLAKRPDRHTAMMAELRKLQWPAIRFEAVERANGAVGCGLSHIECLKLALANGHDYAIILEDDFESLVDAAEFSKTVHAIINRYAGLNICMLAYNDLGSTPYDDLVREAWNCQTTAGYLISRLAIPSLINKFYEAVAGLESGGHPTQFAIDMQWKQLQGSGRRFYLSNTRLGQQRASFSDIQGSFVDYQC